MIPISVSSSNQKRARLHSEEQSYLKEPRIQQVAAAAIASISSASASIPKRKSRWDERPPTKETPFKRGKQAVDLQRCKRINQTIIRIAKDPDPRRAINDLIKHSKDNYLFFNEINILTLLNKLKQLKDEEFFHSEHFLIDLKPQILGFLNSFESKALSNLVEIFASVNQFDRELFSEISREIQERDLKDLELYYLSNIIRAYDQYAKENGCDQSLFEKISQEIQRRSLRDLETYDLSRIVKCFANAEIADRLLFKKIGREIRRRNLEDLDPTYLHKIVYAYSKMKIRDIDLFEKISREIQRRDLGSFKTEQLSNIVKSYAKAAVCDNKILFEKISREIQGRRDVQPKRWCEIAFSYVKESVYDKRLFRKIAQEIQIDVLSSEELGDLVWSLSSAGAHEIQLFEKISREVKEKRGLSHVSSSKLCKIAWSYAVYEAETNQDVRDFCQSLVEELSKRDDLITEEKNILEQVSFFYRFEIDPKLFESLPEEQNRSPMEEEIEEYLAKLLSDSLIVNQSFCGHHPDFRIPERRLIVEVDGASHFYTGMDHPLPKTVFRNAIYQKQGYQVISISSREWNRLNGEREKKEFLKKRLREKGLSE